MQLILEVENTDTDMKEKMTTLNQEPVADKVIINGDLADPIDMPNGNKENILIKGNIIKNEDMVDSVATKKTLDTTATTAAKDILPQEENCSSEQPPNDISSQVNTVENCSGIKNINAEKISVPSNSNGESQSDIVTKSDVSIEEDLLSSDCLIKEKESPNVNKIPEMCTENGSNVDIVDKNYEKPLNGKNIDFDLETTNEHVDIDLQNDSNITEEVNNAEQQNNIVSHFNLKECSSKMLERNLKNDENSKGEVSKTSDVMETIISERNPSEVSINHDIDSETCKIVSNLKEKAHSEEPDDKRKEVSDETISTIMKTESSTISQDKNGTSFAIANIESNLKEKFHFEELDEKKIEVTDSSLSTITEIENSETRTSQDKKVITNVENNLKKALSEDRNEKNKEVSYPTVSTIMESERSKLRKIQDENNTTFEIANIKNNLKKKALENEEITEPLNAIIMENEISEGSISQDKNDTTFSTADIISNLEEAHSAETDCQNEIGISQDINDTYATANIESNLKEKTHSEETDDKSKEVTASTISTIMETENSEANISDKNDVDVSSSQDKNNSTSTTGEGHLPAKCNSKEPAGNKNEFSGNNTSEVEVHSTSEIEMDCSEVELEIGNRVNRDSTQSPMKFDKVIDIDVSENENPMDCDVVTTTETNDGITVVIPLDASMDCDEVIQATVDENEIITKCISQDKPNDDVETTKVEVVKQCFSENVSLNGTQNIIVPPVGNNENTNNNTTQIATDEAEDEKRDGTEPTRGNDVEITNIDDLKVVEEKSIDSEEKNIDAVNIIDDQDKQIKASETPLQQKTIAKKINPSICRLSNTLNILSDDEDEPPKRNECHDTKITDLSDKQCINIDEDDDDIMVIDEDKDENIDTNQLSAEANKLQSEPTLENGTKQELDSAIEKESTEPEKEFTDTSERPEVTDKDSADKTDKFKPLVTADFFKNYKKNLADMTRDDLEEFCILKIVESIIDRSNLNDIKSKMKLMAQTIDENKKKALMLSKQNRDLQVVLKSVQEEQKKAGVSVITPLKITRSVGMQVLMTDKNARRKPPAQTTQFPQPKATRYTANQPRQQTQTNNQQIPVPRLVPASTNATNKTTNVAPQVAPKNVKNVNPPNGIKISPAAPPKAEKRAHNRIQSVTVDLTDDEPPPKVATRSSPVPPVRFVPPQSLVAQPRQQLQPVNSPRKVYIPISGPQGQNQNIRPGQTIMLKSVSPAGPRPRPTMGQIVRVPQNPVRMTRVQGVRHPAPLPDAMKQYQPPNWKALPPTPDLKLSKVENGIVISWKIDEYQEESYEEIASYQLYAYQETSSPPSTSLWKKIGDVKALPLPMACTLTQFMAGYKYYFAVRAVDVRSRLGPFSLPGSILLLNKM